ncbi:hypothetical protein SAMN05428995_1153 [Loktanella sp. DSM 29012]|uniref:hypothetical protein n=1 Tax=Loktanella sp. DSM 29012 TaxID=1881056 RepID=UPI0008BDDE3F|nr:hypothetical protein [Loktanella sp. DSM 29012]SEQ88147.1 hypothetical protein SAMN05428995_1153 [Loktanella sp. DSM 29012]
MTKASGFIVHLSKARQRVFRDALDDQDYFAEAVNRFDHSRSAPLICFVINTKGTITHMARGRRGMNAGTGQSRLNLNDIEVMTTNLTITDIVEGVPKRNRKLVEDRFLNGGLLTPRAFEEVVDLVARLAPETKLTLDRFSKSTRQRLSELSLEARGTLAYQKESVATALHLAGMDREPLAHWTLETEEQPMSFLEGLPQARLREDPMIIHDMMHVPGYDYLKEIKVASAAVFEDGDNRLTVVLANRLPLEEQTGCDLIYYNETFNAFVMVQYKAMEPHDKEGAIFRFPEAKLTEEVARMDAFLAELAKTKPSNAVNDFRLNSDPFFLKFCPRIQFDPDSTGLTKGICVPLSYWKRLEVDDNLKGPKGGRRLAYSNVGRYFDNTSFATMIKGAWVGTTIPQSKLLEKWMRDVISSGRSLTFAVKAGKPGPDGQMRDTHVQPDLGTDGIDEDFDWTATETVKVEL